MRTPRAARVRASLPTAIVYDRIEIRGTLVDISRTGAQVDVPIERTPPLGTPVRLIISGWRKTQIELEAHTARHTPSGFGAHFTGPTPVALLELLIDLGSVALPET